MLPHISAIQRYQGKGVSIIYIEVDMFMGMETPMVIESQVTWVQVQ